MIPNCHWVGSFQSFLVVFNDYFWLGIFKLKKVHLYIPVMFNYCADRFAISKVNYGDLPRRPQGTIEAFQEEEYFHILSNNISSISKMRPEHDVFSRH